MTITSLLIATALGVANGLYGSSFTLAAADIVGTLFRNFLSFLSVPLIFLSLTSTITGMESREYVLGKGRRVLKYTLLTTILAAIVGLLCFWVIDPAVHASALRVGSAVTDGAGWDTYAAFLQSIVPANFIHALGAGANVLSVVFLALIVSSASFAIAPEHRRVVHAWLAAFFQVFLAIAGYALVCMPFGVWAFATEFVSAVMQDATLMLSLGRYIAMVLSANLLQGVVVIPFLLWYKGFSPLRIFTAFRPALIMAFFSKSSSATLPLTLKCAKERAHLSSETSAFTLPLCTTINMNGCAAFILTTVLFVSAMEGFPLSFLEALSWIFIATAAAVGNAGVPMGCFFLTSAFLTSLGLPLTIMGAILPLYAFIDMVETALNVWSDAAVAVLVDAEVQRADSSVS